MLKIGIVGLGHIAQKAYLPILGRLPIELNLCTRNTATLTHISLNYRLPHIHSTLDELIASGVKGAFVHTSTSSHEEVIEKLLNAGIHVYVDKPLVDNLAAAQRLHDLATRKGVLLMVGFNRRFAPDYSRLRNLPGANMIVLQKNRSQLAHEVRPFIFDDFIHVIDTLVYLIPGRIDQWSVVGKSQKGKLYHVVLTIQSGGVTALGVMNRDAGTTEEKLEVFTSEEKYTVLQLRELIISKNQINTHSTPSEWTETLYQRGFPQIIDFFLNAVDSPDPASHSSDFLTTHQLCEEIVQRLEKEC